MLPRFEPGHKQLHVCIMFIQRVTIQSTSKQVSESNANSNAAFKPVRLCLSEWHLGCSTPTATLPNALHSHFLGFPLSAIYSRPCGSQHLSCNRQIVGQPRQGKMSEKMFEKCPKLSRGAENTIFRHFLGNFCLFGRCFCLATLSNARPLQHLRHFGSSFARLQIASAGIQAIHWRPVCRHSSGI